jgi:hypothetical protein
VSERAFEEFQILITEIENLQTHLNDSQEKDAWTYIWGNNKLSSSRLYHYTFRNVHPPRPFIWLWESKCSNKLKVFNWLLFMDRLNTRNILKRKNFKIQDNDYNCVLCDLKREETAFHLFFHCPFSKRCWQKININWNYQTDFFTTFEQARQTHGSIYFMETFIITAWQIWKQRNNLSLTEEDHLWTAGKQISLLKPLYKLVDFR